MDRMRDTSENITWLNMNLAKTRNHECIYVQAHISLGIWGGGLYQNTVESGTYMCHGFVSAGDALGRECLVTPMSSFLAGRSGCK